jgi:hypothetical protein
MSRIRRLSMTLFAACVFAPAAHAVGWVTSGPLSPPDRVPVQLQAVVAPGGERAIAWVQEVPSRFTFENVSVRVAAPGGGFGPIQTFPGFPDSPRLAVTGDGTLVLAWIDISTGAVHVARRAPGQQSFVEANPFLVPGGQGVSALALSAEGDDAILAVTSFGPGGDGVSAARLAAAGSTPQLIPGTGPAGSIDEQGPANGQPVSLTNPGIATDSGHVYVSWEQQTNGPFQVGTGVTRVREATSMEGGPNGLFGAPSTLDTLTGTSPNAPEAEARVAAGGGHAYELWLRLSADTVVYQDLTGGPVRTIPTEDFFDEPQIGVDQSGALFVAGRAFARRTDTEGVAETIIPAGGSPTRPVNLTAVGLNRQLDGLAVASDGSALALPGRETNDEDQTFELQAAVRSPGGTFGGLEEVSGLQDTVANFEEQPAAAIAPGGQALALWAATDHSGAVSERVHVSERDTTPPRLTSVSAPARAAVGQRAGFSAAATDEFSNPTISWNFGDGSQATGARVSHVFGTPGAHTITVTATDSVGNSSTQTQVVAVVAAGGNDHTPPVISGLSLTHARFRVARNATAEIAAGRGRTAGTMFRAVLSEQATLAIVIRHGRGVRGTLVRAGRGPGAVAIHFSGRIGRTALAPARYTASFTAIDGAGNRSRPRTISFTVLR